MRVWPAIDLRDGKCVRLRQGDYQRETVFSDDPLAMADRWVGEGADCLHLVDLDGARDGRLVNADAIRRIANQLQVTLQLGGGIRDETSIQSLLNLGLDRLVIGTQALKHPAWFQEMASKYPSQLVLGIDARAGQVATDGWLETSQTSAIELAQQFDELPLAGIVYTDIAKDGMLAGPNLAATQEMNDVSNLPVIASGGVTSMDDVHRLTALMLDGCIVGRALYEGRLALADVIDASNEK